MNWSLGEIGALCIKATRGAGHPWGVAEEAGWAVRWLSSRGFPGAEACSEWLAGGEGPCPVSHGIAICDRSASELPADLGEMAVPLMALPFLARSLPADRAVCLDLGGVLAILSRDALEMTTTPPRRARVLATPHDGARPVCTVARRIEAVDPDAMRTLEDFAHRIYAPASEQSRLQGAGAGLTDND